MAFSALTFGKLQDEDLAAALARQQMHEDGQMGIVKAQEGINIARSREAVDRDNMESNRVHREGLIEERKEGRLSRERMNAAEDEKLRQGTELQAEQRKILTDMAKNHPDPMVRKHAEAELAGLKTTPLKIGGGMKPVFRGDRETGAPRQVGEVPDDAIFQTDPAEPKVNITMPGSQLNPAQYRAAIASLSQQYTRDTADERKSMQVYRNSKMAWDAYKQKAAARDPGAQAIMVNFQKTLDPESVVRESEYLRSADGQPMASKLRAAWTQITQGGPSITDEGMQSYLNVMAEWAAEAKKWHDIKAERITRIADDFKIEHDRIIPRGDLMPTAAPAAGAASGGRKVGDSVTLKDGRRGIFRGVGANGKPQIEIQP
jgi:hypothetical protein